MKGKMLIWWPCNTDSSIYKEYNYMSVVWIFPSMSSQLAIMHFMWDKMRVWENPHHMWESLLWVFLLRRYYFVLTWKLIYARKPLQNGWHFADISKCVLFDVSSLTPARCAVILNAKYAGVLRGWHPSGGGSGGGDGGAGLGGRLWCDEEGGEGTIH